MLAQLIRLTLMNFSTRLLVLVVLLGSGAALANTPGRLRAKAVPLCYCQCAQHSRSNCAKMCELPRYASRWWATSCARLQLREPGENPDAGPRLHHREHAERASR